MEDNQQLFTPREAVEYLAEHRNMHYTVASLRVKRARGQAHTARRYGAFSLWTKEELDAIEPPKKRGRPKKEDLSQAA